MDLTALKADKEFLQEEKQTPSDTTPEEPHGLGNAEVEPIDQAG